MSLYYEVEAKKPTGKDGRNWFLYARGSAAVPDVVRVPGTDALSSKTRRILEEDDADSYLVDHSLRPDVLFEAEPEPEPEPVQEDPVSPGFRAHYEHLLNLLSRIDPESLVVLDLHLDGLTQTEIAERFGVTQPSVCGRLQRLRRWLGLARLPRISPARLQHALDVVRASKSGPFGGRGLGAAERDAVALVVLEHRLQTEAARMLGRTQGWVRHGLLRAHAQIAACGEFDDVAAVLHAAMRPGWAPSSPVQRRTWQRKKTIVEKEREMQPALRGFELELVRFLDAQTSASG